MNNKNMDRISAEYQKKQEEYTSIIWDISLN